MVRVMPRMNHRSKRWGFTILAFTLACAAAARAPLPEQGRASEGATVTLLSESFESWPPPGWIVYPDPQTGGKWRSLSHPEGCSSGSSSPYTNNTGGSGLCADANSDCNGDEMDTTMVTPPFSLDLSSYISATLQFKSDFLCAANLDEAWVDITTDGGAIWTNLLYFDHQSVRGPSTQTLDLTPYLGHSDVRLSFEYTAPDWDWYWQVDDVVVTAVQQQTCTLACTADASPAAGYAPLAVQFVATAQLAGCGDAQPAFHWVFGDGASSEERSPSHSYESAGSYGWTLTVTAGDQTCARSGSVVVHPPGAALPGDCDGSGSVSIGEVQKTINMFLGVTQLDCGVDCNGDGVVSIGEVQKVVNLFLGLDAGC